MPSPPITEELKAEAKRTPNGYVYVLDGEVLQFGGSTRNSHFRSMESQHAWSLVRECSYPTQTIGITPTNFRPVISNLTFTGFHNQAVRHDVETG